MKPGWHFECSWPTRRCVFVRVGVALQEETYHCGTLKLCPVWKKPSSWLQEEEIVSPGYNWIKRHNSQIPLQHHVCLDIAMFPALLIVD